MLDNDDLDEGMSEQEQMRFDKIMSDQEITDDDEYEEEEIGASVVSPVKASGSQSGLQVWETSRSEIAVPEDADDLDVVFYGLRNIVLIRFAMNSN